MKTPDLSEEDAIPKLDTSNWPIIALLTAAISAWAIFAGVVWVFGRMIESAIALGWPV